MSKENPQVKLSPKERAILRECYADLTLKKALPFSVITCALLGFRGFIKLGGNITQNLIGFKTMVAISGIAGFPVVMHSMPKYEDKFLTLEPHGEMAKCKSMLKIAIRFCIQTLFNLFSAIRKRRNLPEPVIETYQLKDTSDFDHLLVHV